MNIEFLKNWLLKNALDIEILRKMIKQDLINSMEISDAKKNEIIDKCQVGSSFLVNFIDAYLENGIVRLIMLINISIITYSMSEIHKSL